MTRRFVSIWFRHLATDWFALRNPALKKLPFVLRTPVHGRMVISATNATATNNGIHPGMVLADARAIFPNLHVEDDKPDLIGKLLAKLAEWSIRFTPIAAVDPPDGLLLDASGCAHLWGGEAGYLETIVKRFTERGYDMRAAMADTPGAAWAIARFGKSDMVIDIGSHPEALLPMPPEAFRLEPETADRLHKLGLRQFKDFVAIPRASLRRRFGQHFIRRLDMVLGKEEEFITPVYPPEPYQERLPCFEPITTAEGIAIAIGRLLESLCLRLRKDQKGLRQAIFKCYRVDGKVEQVAIGTNLPSHHVKHLFKLFEIKLPDIEPALGIELFVLEAPKVEDHFPQQEKMWGDAAGLEDTRLCELIDRLSGKIGAGAINRYIPDERFWPERSLKVASLHQKAFTTWPDGKHRPLHLLQRPEHIQVTAPIPDYPPMLFRHKGRIHKIVRADGPERIEQEWWIQQGQHRDYYRVEDEDGQRYWLFRSGHYDDKKFQWYLHGFFP